MFKAAAVHGQTRRPHMHQTRSSAEALNLPQGPAHDPHRKADLPHHKRGFQPENTPPETNQHVVPPHVSPLASDTKVRPTVNLHEQPPRRSRKVRDEPSNRILPTELHAQLLCAKLLPKERLRRGERSAHGCRAAEEHVGRGTKRA